MLDGWFCRTVANQKSMDQDEDAQSDSQEGNNDLNSKYGMYTSCYKSMIKIKCWQQNAWDEYASRV